jgi:hypothetical protein
VELVAYHRRRGDSGAAFPRPMMTNKKTSRAPASLPGVLRYSQGGVGRLA